jgi:type IV pilus assembly protein PilB
VNGIFTDELVDQLVACGYLTEEQREEATESQRVRGGTLCEQLLGKGMITERHLLGCYAKSHGVTPVTLENLEIEPEVLEMVPEKIAQYYKAVPIARAGTYLTVAMVDPLNVFALDDLSLLTDLKILPVVALHTDIERLLEKHYHQQEDYEEILAGLEDTDVTEAHVSESEINIDQMQEEMSAAPVIKLVNVILTQAIDERASDIHIEPFERRMSVRYRIDGVLYERPTPPFAMHRGMVSRLKVMAQLDISERRLPQDGRFRIRTRGREVDFRISTLPTVYGEKIVMRVLDKTAQQMDVERLGFDPLGQERFVTALDSPHGMVLVTGPTGSGKTTTLYAALHRINTPQVNIVTVEDPVEYQFPGVNQVQVNPDIKLTFAAGLRSILRQDPDIVMVGEVRDFETADIAVKAALTGHLVLTTLHTNDASSAFVRLTDMGVEPYLAASAINLVVAQRLVRRLCDRCKESAKIDAAILKRAQYRGVLDGSEQFHKPVGCPYCRQTGYAGRMALLEALPVTDEMRRLMLSNGDAPQIKQLALSQEMETLRQAGLRRVVEGSTSLQEVLRVTAAD